MQYRQLTHADLADPYIRLRNFQGFGGGRGPMTANLVVEGKSAKAFLHDLGIEVVVDRVHYCAPMPLAVVCAVQLKPAMTNIQMLDLGFTREAF